MIHGTMLNVIPRRAFFTFEFPVYHVARAPRVDGDVTKWKTRFLAPPLYAIDDERGFAEVWWAWSDDYFCVAYDVRMKRRPECDVSAWWKMDGVRLCIDTRNLRRSSRFSYFFYILPIGGGTDRRQPVFGTHKLSKAKESPPKFDVTEVKLASRATAHGYTLEAAIPTRLLGGWDAVEHPRIGLFYKVKDHLGASQHLSVTDDLGWNADPGVWGEGVLQRE